MAISSNSVMFTALPSGIVSAATTGTEVSLSVYVTPQLLAGASLTSTPGFANWPSVASGLTFAATLTSTATSKSITATCSLDTRAAYATDRFDSALWAAFFGPPAGATSSSIPVNLFAVPNYTASGTLSYGTQPVSAAVKTAYTSVATRQSKPNITAGGTDTLSTTTAQVARAINVPAAAGGATLANAGQVVLASVKGSINATAASLSSAALTTLTASGQVPNTPAAEFARVAAYHNRKNYRALTPVGVAGQTTVVPPLDFHQIVGHLADHPAILRRLGLLIDLTFIIPAGSGIDGSSNLVVKPTVTTVSGLTVAAPTTGCIVHEYGSTSAVAFRPLYGDVDNNTSVLNPLIDTNGLLWTDNASLLTMDTLDVDHAAIQVSNFAEQAQSDLAATPAPTSGAASLEVTLPALKTTGFALHHNNRETLIGKRFALNANWGSANTFFAEDFYRGMRIDVRTVTGTTTSAWASLCQRTSTFTFTNGHAAVAISDEGYVKSSAMSASSTDPVYNVHETLFNWDGWSLVSARPGLSVGSATATTQTDGGVVATGSGVAAADGPVVPLPANAGAAMNLSFTNAIVPLPGSLTKLRFGTTYQFRVRAVDIAGNDMRLSAATDNALVHASPATTFARYEPVSPPVIQLRKPVTEGESVEYLVIRSDPYGPTAINPTTWASENSAAPNGTALVNAGMNAYFPTSERHFSPPQTSVQMAEWHGAIDSAVASVPAATRAQSAWAIISKEDGTYYDAMVTDTSTGQYRTLAQSGRSIVTPPGSQLALVMAQGAGTPTFTGTQDVTRGDALVNGQYVAFDTTQVYLPYLPDPNAAGVTFQGLPSTSTPPTAAYRTWGARVANPSGQSWPELSPWRLVLTGGAVGSAATVSGLNPASAVGTPVTVTLPPSAQLEVSYSSMITTPTAHAFCPTDTADQTSAANGLVPLLSPARSITLVHAVQRPMAPGLVSGDIVPQDRNPGETAQAVVATYRFDGASTGRLDFNASWEEYVDRANVADPTQPIPHSGMIDTITANPTDTLILSKTVRQLFGDTKRRDITYSTKATTRFREFFPSSITTNTANITNQTSLPTLLTCKSSARPPVPKVLYAVPSFMFGTTGATEPPASGTTSTSTRSGGVVRVYVDRGWFATGAGECLGLVLAPNPSLAAQTTISTKYPSLVSQWGPDPIWYQGTLNALDLTHVNFATSFARYQGVALAEGVGTVDIACFAPNFNAARGLWYFDIGLNTDQAYFPFLRLALVRFQPESILDPSNPIPGATMQASPVVLTEFVQLSATRSASVTNMGNGNYNVSVSGVTAPNLATLGTTPAQLGSGHTVTAEFQEATTTTPDDIDWATIGYVDVLAPGPMSGMSMTYTASLAFPSFAATTGANHRILFKEYEVYATDPQAGVEQGVGVQKIGSTNTAYTQRIVYADSILIPS